MTILEEIKSKIVGEIADAFSEAAANGELESTDINIADMIKLEVPKDKQHGDYACNIAMQLAKPLRTAPRNIANAIVSHISGGDIEKCEVAGAGFINFYLKPDYLYKVMQQIEQKNGYGKIDLGKGKKVMVEFVSANPTGPMHMGNARGGALGDCLASVLEYAGYDVTREFYVNDAGNQIEKFASSLNARYIQELKGEDAIEFPEDGYHGDDIREHAKAFITIHGDKYLNTDESERRAALVDYALEKNVTALREDLEKYRIVYDVWFRESNLHKNGDVKAAIQRLTDNGYTYEEDGAVWLNCEKMGLEKNEVLVRKNGIPTYFAADIAYHINKLETRGYDWAINIWGADHHGHVARMKKALAACGINSDKLEVVLMQLVRLMQNGEIVRMSKRTGKAITLSDLLEDISVDAARFFFNMREPGSTIDFDLGLAVKEDSQNPVYYCQYANARICSILRKMKEEGIEPRDCTEEELMLLNAPEERELIRHLSALTDEIITAAKDYDPARITRYAVSLATLFHKFYNACRVGVDDEKLRAARLYLCCRVKDVMGIILTEFKITVPESM